MFYKSVFASILHLPVEILKMARLGTASMLPRLSSSEVNQRKDEGKPAQKVLQWPNCSVSFARRLCKSVVPVRGWPRMKSGRLLSGYRAMVRPYKTDSTNASTELTRAQVADRWFDLEEGQVGRGQPGRLAAA